MVAADNGAAFAQKAQQLCTYLMDKSTPEYKIKSHIREMKALITKAHRDAVNTSAKFRESRTSMNQVTSLQSEIPAVAMIPFETGYKKHSGRQRRVGETASPTKLSIRSS